MPVGDDFNRIYGGRQAGRLEAQAMDRMMSAGETLLIVDDARLTRMMVKSFAGKARPGIAILEAAEAGEAQRLLESHAEITHITIDYNMPGMNGLELAALVKENRPQMRIALLTANVQGALRRRAAELCVEFLEKPVTEAKIIGFLTPQQAVCDG